MTKQSNGAYLLTFWPPGPDDLEKLVFARLVGIVFSLKFENHRRAASISAAFSPSPYLDVYDLQL